MRTAALGLYFLSRPEDLPGAVAQVSRITHQDPRSVAGGVAVASAARLMASCSDIEPSDLCRFVAEDVRPYHASLADLIVGLPPHLSGNLQEALEYVAWSGGQCREFETVIITPYVIPTVLAALWAVTSFPNSWPDAVAAVIRLGGDVDTLGAIVGGLMGAKLGLSAIPDHLATSVLDSSKLRVLAERYAEIIKQNCAFTE
jgi:ADP-ribosyl-[dinitrogen reductase] hydrolase